MTVVTQVRGRRPRMVPAQRRTATKRTAARPVSRPASRGGTFWLLSTLVLVLCAFGLVMVLSASSIVSLTSYGTPWYFFLRQFLWLCVGGGGFALAVRVHHSAWRRAARPFMYGTLVLLAAVLVPGVGVRAYGASRWLGTSLIQIQPSEIAKLALVFFAADVLDRREGSTRWQYEVGPVLAVLGMLVILVMLQPDMGTTLVLLFIATAMLFAAGVPRRVLAGMGVAGVMGCFLVAKAAPYRWRRMTAFLHPFADTKDTGWQSLQSYLALSHGHALGDGLGSSIASYGWLPNAQTDFIFAVIGEETGLLGGFFVCALFSTLALVGTRISCRAPSRFAALTAAGITAWLVGQAVINIGAVVGLLPVTGVPLPFVSFGGSALVISLFAAGVLANIAMDSGRA